MNYGIAKDANINRQVIFLKADTLLKYSISILSTLQ